jgi:thiol:disulfide interchange protein DsbD
MGFQALLVALFFAFVGGLVLNLMPCVLPVLSIKALSLVKAAQGNPGRARAEGLWYLAGVLVCFAAIGAILVALRAAGEQAGLGFQLQSPFIVAVLALVMLLVGLNLSGVFDLGQSLTSAGQSLTDRSGAKGAFFTGLLAAVVGAPCVGPFMATAVGALVTQPAPIVVLAFVTIGFGMALPVLMLSLSPGLRRFVPKPGAWMETFKQFLAFPMYLTAVWLVWVLAGQAGMPAVSATLFVAVLVAFSAWVFGMTQRGDGGAWSWLGRAVALAGLIGSVALMVNATLSETAKREAGTAEAAQALAQNPDDALDLVWSPEAQAEQLQAGKAVFVDFTARWCITCQVNKQTTLSQPRVRQAFATHDVAFFVADWTDRNDIIAAELARHGWAGVPLYLYYPPGQSEPQILPQLLSPDLVIKTVSAPQAS